MESQTETDALQRRALVDQLVALLRVTPLAKDCFRGDSEDVGYPTVYGGQVLGQATMAASLTLAARPIHSLHAYFLRSGDPHRAIDYVVERVRDGRSFSTRRVVATQGGQEIFEMTASFQERVSGVEHQSAMPNASSPRGVPSDPERRRALALHKPGHWPAQFVAERPIEYRSVDAPDLQNPAPRDAKSQIWMRALAPLPDQPMLHCALLAYASDQGLLRAALLPHGLSFTQKGVRCASLDHAMWFHRDFRIDDWLLYNIDSPTAQGARALCRGEVFASDGRLVASVAQEGMVRVRPP